MGLLSFTKLKTHRKMLFYIFGVLTSDYADDQKSKSINSKRFGRKKLRPSPRPKLGVASSCTVIDERFPVLLGLQTCVCSRKVSKIHHDEGEGWYALYTCIAPSTVEATPNNTVNPTIKATANQKLYHCTGFRLSFHHCLRLFG
jgi:hypothetical protein